MFDDRLPGALRDAGVPDELAAGLTGGSGGAVSEETAAVGDLAWPSLRPCPRRLGPRSSRSSGAIVDGMHQAVSVATGNVFWIGIGAITVAFLVLLPLREVPLPKRARVARAEGEADAADERLSAEPA